MSDIMRAIPFRDLLRQLQEEFRLHGSFFAVKTLYNACEHREEGKEDLTLFGRRLEIPLGVAAGPHTQLAQNIAACYAGGARFIELKTIQRLYGEDLGIPRPCIRAQDEGYNVEWSSEYSPQAAMDEYVKAWFLCKVLAKEYGLGDPDAFQFNMSVGYNYEGLLDPAVNSYIDSMKNAAESDCFKDCKAALLEAVEEGRLKHADRAFVESISPEICNSLTLSTMHGCPPDEIEKMAMYILEEKKLNLYVKINPTLLGYERVRAILDEQGFDYVRFGREQFEADLQPAQALPMLKRLQAKGDELGLVFGVKLTNTFQTDITLHELPGKNMYMSGRALLPLSVAVGEFLSEAFDNSLPMSFSGGVDQNNLTELLAANICPLTVCTVLLRPRGLNKLADMAKLAQAAEVPARAYAAEGKTGRACYVTKHDKIKALLESVLADKRYKKNEAQRKKYLEAGDWNVGRHDHHVCRVLCGSCVDVCPNRANVILTLGEKERIILHIDRNCNECGNCQFHCVQPCLPYRDRITLFHSEEDLDNSENKGVCFLGVKDGYERFAYRWDKRDSATYSDLPEVLKGVVDAILADRAYLL